MMKKNIERARDRGKSRRKNSYNWITKATCEQDCDIAVGRSTFWTERIEDWLWLTDDNVAECELKHKFNPIALKILKCQRYVCCIKFI